MNETTSITLNVTIGEEKCEVTANKIGKQWKASGVCRGEPITGRPASTSMLAFEYWKKRASMQPGD
jgi:hypothetical protein